MTETEIRNQVVSTAKSWLGKNEWDGSFKSIIDLYNSHSPLPRGYKVKYTDEWCATTISALAYTLNLQDIIPPECGCEEQIKLFKKLNCWVEADDYVPLPGDIIYYNWQGKPGANTGYADHVGVVETVVGNTITVIEGNKGQSVQRRTVPVNYVYTRGFGVPNYASKVSKDADEPWDVKAQKWAIKNGVSDGTAPDRFATRAEVWAMLSRLKG